MPRRAWLELRNSSGGMIGLADMVSGSWALEMVGGCGSGSFTLARTWDDIADLADLDEVRVKVDGDTWWIGRLANLNCEDEKPPVLECSGYREELKGLGWYHREWTTIDNGTTQDPAYGDPMLNLATDVAPDVLTRLTSLYPTLTASSNLISRQISYATLEGDGYGVLDQFVSLYGGDAIWGVDQDKTLYLKTFPDAPAENMHFFHGRNVRMAFSRDNSSIVNIATLVGQDKSFDTDVGLETQRVQRAAALHYLNRTPFYHPKINPFWNPLPNANFEQRRAEIGSIFQNTAAPYTYDNYSWVGCKMRLASDVQLFYPSISGRPYAASADPTRAGETGVRFEIPSPVATNNTSYASIATVRGGLNDPNANEDSRVAVAPSTDVRVSAMVYKVGATHDVTAQWILSKYNPSEGASTETKNMPVALADGWNTWATSQGGGMTSQGQGTDLSYTFTLANDTVQVGIELRLYLNDVATSQALYVDNWQLQTTPDSKPFSPSTESVMDYDVSDDYMNTEEPEITASKSTYGVRYTQTKAPFRDSRYANEADGLQFMRAFFRNYAVPIYSGTVVYLGDPPLFKPWEGMMRLHGLPKSIESELKRFASEEHVDLQVDAVNYEWTGALRATLNFSHKKRIIPIAERGMLDHPPPPGSGEGWRANLERMSKARQGPITYRERHL